MKEKLTEDSNIVSTTVNAIETFYDIHPACFSIILTIVFGLFFGWLFCYKKKYQDLLFLLPQ